MDLVFLHGPPAAGKLTIGRRLAERTGFALFHNHLVVDAVGAVFPFGAPDFRRLRERWWLDMFDAAARAGQSLIFTFQPEPSVAQDFPTRAATVVEAAGGRVHFVRLTLPLEEQRRRIDAPSREAFGKMRSVDLLDQLHPQFAEAEARMPPSALTIDTATVDPDEAAARIVAGLNLTAPVAPS